MSATPDKPLNVSIVRKLAAVDEPAPSVPATNAVVPTRPPTAEERFTQWITRPFMAAPILIVCLSLLSWSLLIRWPHEPVRVHARPVSIPAGSGTAVAVTAEEVATLQNHASLLLGRVMTNGDQMPGVLSTFEQRARNAGFVAEVSTRPVELPIANIPQLSMHRIVLRLENNYDRAEPAFFRLLNWLQETRALEVKAEVAALSLHSLGDGLTAATVEIYVPAFQADAPPAAK